MDAQQREYGPMQGLTTALRRLALRLRLRGKAAPLFLSEEEHRLLHKEPPRRESLPEPFLDSDGFPIPLLRVRHEVERWGGTIGLTPDATVGRHVAHDWSITHPERPTIGLWFFQDGVTRISHEGCPSTVDIDPEGLDTPYLEAPEDDPNRTELSAFLLAAIREGVWGAWEGRYDETYPAWPDPE